jgi:hypothetical protein
MYTITTANVLLSILATMILLTHSSTTYTTINSNFAWPDYTILLEPGNISASSLTPLSVQDMGPNHITINANLSTSG